MYFPKEIIDGLRLKEGEVLVWTAELDSVTETRLEQLARLLSQDEEQKASRFRFERDQKRFTVCRGILREILGTYLKKDPKKIDFNYGPQGKPYLKGSDRQADGSLYFNVSHSSGWAIYALGLGEVGVDLEFVRPIPEMQALVDQYFSVAERRAFGSVLPNLQLKAFYHCWTRKEAYVKACGGGLQIPLDQFDVSVDPELPAQLIRVQQTPGDQLPWSLHSFDPSAEAVAALVCPKNNEPCLCGSWPPMSHLRGHQPSPALKGLMTDPRSLE
jgi:4'-phosphopantetheinyl transferase